MKIALLFPGYGSQFVGMGKELYNDYRIVQEYFEEASNCINTNFVKLCFASSDAELSKINNAYTSLFLVGSSIFALLKELEIEPDIVAGYNNGEFAAMFAGGCFSFPDGLYLLNKYSTFFIEALENKSVDAVRIIGVPTEKLEKICLQVSVDEGMAFIAMYHGATDHIVAGHAHQIEQIRDILGSDQQVTIERVDAEMGLHSQLMDPVLDQFKIYLEKVDFRDMRIPFLSSLNGQLISKGQEVKDSFINHINSPLVFTRVLNGLLPYDVIIIACPGEKLSQIIKKQYPEKKVVSIARGADIEALKGIFAKELT